MGREVQQWAEGRITQGSEEEDPMSIKELRSYRQRGGEAKKNWAEWRRGGEELGRVDERWRRIRQSGGEGKKNCTEWRSGREFKREGEN